VTESFSIVIPTYRRARTLESVLPSYLATGAAEVVLVDDGSGPPEGALLEELARHDGVQLVRLPHVGLPAARNAGIDAASGEWIVFGEDDCWYPADYPSVLIAHAIEFGAMACSGSARLVHPGLLTGDPGELDRTIRSGETVGQHDPDRLLGLPWPVQRLSSGDVLTPLLTAGAAIHRSVFQRVRFDPRYRGNAFREETDFFLSCHELGLPTLRCPHAVCGHLKVHARGGGGGAWAMGRARYGWHMAANNWRFVRKHRDALVRARRAAGSHGGPVRIQLEFMRDLLRRARTPAEEPSPPSTETPSAPAAGRSSTSPPPEAGDRGR
jgi:glycosyltransferase involved in cell wall biosynthesis